MRTLKTTLALIGVLLLLPFSELQSQDKYWVHEDVVKPSMALEYETITKELITNLKKHNSQEVNVLAVSLADSRYLFVSPMKNMADLDKPIFAPLAEKMGGTALSDLFDRMNKSYDVEHDYVITLDKELSYMPTGITQTPEGQDYRKFHYLYVTPSKDALVKEKMKAVKNLFESKGSKSYYRVYKSGFGARGNFYMVAIAAKDAVDYEQKSAANDALLGEEGQQALGAVFGNLLKYEEFIGRMRPDMGYSPSN